MKVLILIISSDTDPVYAEHKKVWSSYMNSNPQIECYFIQYRDGPQAIEGNIFWLNGVESFPAILTKTLDSLDYFLKKDSYDFIIRTNMSSLWNFNALLKHLETLPREKVYNGIPMYHYPINFVSGCGFIITPDVANIIIYNRVIAEKIKIMDDVDIGGLLQHFGIKILNGTRTDITSLKIFSLFKFDKNIYHYRFRQDDSSNRYLEPQLMNKILDIINN